MGVQLSFFAAPRRSPGPASPLPRPEPAAVVTYFAILPPEDVRDAIVRLRHETVKRERIFGRAVAPERLHISIAPLVHGMPTDVPVFAPLGDDIAYNARMSAFDVR